MNIRFFCFYLCLFLNCPILAKYDQSSSKVFEYIEQRPKENKQIPHYIDHVITDLLLNKNPWININIFQEQLLKISCSSKDHQYSKIVFNYFYNFSFISQNRSIITNLQKSIKDCDPLKKRISPLNQAIKLLSSMKKEKNPNIFDPFLKSKEIYRNPFIIALANDSNLIKSLNLDESKFKFELPNQVKYILDEKSLHAIKTTIDAYTDTEQFEKIDFSFINNKIKKDTKFLEDIEKSAFKITPNLSYAAVIQARYSLIITYTKVLNSYKKLINQYHNEDNKIQFTQLVNDFTRPFQERRDLIFNITKNDIEEKSILSKYNYFFLVDKNYDRI